MAVSLKLRLQPSKPEYFTAQGSFESKIVQRKIGWRNNLQPSNLQPAIL
jgi:hypothetical protein